MIRFVLENIAENNRVLILDMIWSSPPPPLHPTSPPNITQVTVGGTLIFSLLYSKCWTKLTIIIKHVICCLLYCFSSELCFSVIFQWMIWQDLITNSEIVFNINLNTVYSVTLLCNVLSTYSGQCFLKILNLFSL